jgi:hypothetical protein
LKWRCEYDIKASVEEGTVDDEFVLQLAIDPEELGAYTIEQVFDLSR